MFTEAIIFAGGNGVRMAPLTDYIPKPLVKVDNKCLIDYGIDLFREHGIDNIHVTYGYRSDQLVLHLNERVNSLINTIDRDNAFFLFNSLIKNINVPVLLIPCDIIFDIDFKALYHEYMDLGSPPACIVPVETNMDADHIQSAGNLVTGIDRNTKTGICASGIQVINPSAINERVPKCENFYDVWTHLINKQELFVTNTRPNRWKSFDTIADLL